VFGYIKQYRGGLKDRKILASAVNKHWDATIWVHSKEPRFLLGIFGDIHGYDTVQVGRKACSDSLTEGRMQMTHS